MAEHDVKIGEKPLSECSVEELYHEWDAGMVLDAMEGLSPSQLERLQIIEREMDRRSEPNHGRA